MKLQQSFWSCGAAAVRNVLRVFGHKISEHEIRGISCTTKEFGTSEVGIKRALREYGLSCREHHFDEFDEAWEWLHETLVGGRPVILCVDNWEHWVVAMGSLGQSGVVIFDSSNFKVNTYENGTHVWDYDILEHKWWNSRKSIDDDSEHRIYGISVWQN